MNRVIKCGGACRLLRPLVTPAIDSLHNGLSRQPIDIAALQAGVFEPSPTDENALADNLGLMLNCINSGLYMVNTAACMHVWVCV